MQALNVFLLLDCREAGVPGQRKEYLFDELWAVWGRHEDGSLSHSVWASTS